jgi:hypothetical protein
MTRLFAVDPNWSIPVPMAKIAPAVAADALAAAGPVVPAPRRLTGGLPTGRRRYALAENFGELVLPTPAVCSGS